MGAGRAVERPKDRAAVRSVLTGIGDAETMAKPKVSGGMERRLEIESALRTLEAEAGGISALAAAIRDGLGAPLIAAVEMIERAKGRLIVTGMGKSGHIGRKIAATFASTGTPAFFVHPGEASHGDLGMITADDVIMALSWSGETVELKDLVDYSRRFRIGLIAVTAKADSALAQAADIVLVLPQAREACPHNLAPTTSSLMQLALGDVLAIALLESRGFTALDYRMLHPGGRLGAMLKFVRDIMHTGAAVPLLPLGTRMSEALVEISTKSFGCVGIIDPAGLLVGIITDGDLRRHMRHDLLDTRVEQVMTRAPKTLLGDQLASEALELLNSSKITAAIVIDNGKPIGIVHLHDLLRVGVA
jgi:arabinose-5-phosphate isomerase